MKIIFFGLGSIGTRHAKFLKSGFNHKLFAFRSKRAKTKNKLRIKELYTWKEVDAIAPDIAFITNPTFRHIDTAIRCAQKGMHLFIEKPLDSRIHHLNKLLRVVKEKRVATYVAYVLRFHPVIRYIKKEVKKNTPLHMRVWTSSYLPSWRAKQDFLQKYSARKKMGGGVIYDLSHEIDYTQYILGDIQSMKGDFAKRSSVTVDAEDYADILVSTKRGPANIHINFLSQYKQRIIQVDFKDKAIVGDLINGTIAEYKNGKIIRQRSFPKGYDQCYKEQLKFFFKNLNKKRMMSDVFESAELLKKLYAFKKVKQFHG